MEYFFAGLEAGGSKIPNSISYTYLSSHLIHTDTEVGKQTPRVLKPDADASMKQCGFKKQFINLFN